VDAIEIDLRVVDARGETVTDLDASEVEIFEDGVPQTLVGFARVSVPAAAPLERSPRLAPADVVSNRAIAMSRVFVLLLDDLHVDNRHAEAVKRGATQFVRRHFAAGDLGSVVYASGRADAAQDFTSDPERLVASIDKFVGRKLRPATVERMEQYNMLYRGRGRPNFEDLRDRQDGERAFNARSSLATIEAVSGVLSRVSGKRKAMIVFSEGIDYDLSGLRSRGRVLDASASAPAAVPTTAPTGAGEVAAVGRTDVHNYSNEVLISLQTAIGAASRANVALYTIDSRSGNVTDTLGDLGAPLADPGLGLTAQHTATEMRDAQETLWMLADNTGGFATLAGTAYDDVFARVVRESSEYYVAAYSPTNTARDGTYRDIKVRVKRPDVKVLARQGYYAPRAPTKAVSRFAAPGISAETSALVMAPLPSSGLGLDVQVVALRHDRKRADLVVTLQLDGGELGAGARTGSVTNTLEVALMAIDSTGKIQAATGSSIPIRLEGEAADILRRAGYRAISRVQVPPGRYQVRVAAREQSGGRRGSVHASIDVPDFHGRLALSSWMLSSDEAEVVPTSIDTDTNERMPVLPVVRRSFGAGDELSAAIEIYDSSRQANLAVTTTVVDAAGRERYRSAIEVGREDLKALSGAYVHAVQIPLEAVAGGADLLVEARPAASQGPPVTRRVSFAVVPRASSGSEPARP
jgi:VWFA-related protein